jgi:hypothetical protein
MAAAEPDQLAQGAGLDPAPRPPDPPKKAALGHSKGRLSFTNTNTSTKNNQPGGLLVRVLMGGLGVLVSVLGMFLGRYGVRLVFLVLPVIVKSQSLAQGASGASSSDDVVLTLLGGRSRPEPPCSRRPLPRR